MLSINLLRLRGAGKKKFHKIRTQRRQERQTLEAVKSGISKVTLPPRFRRPHAEILARHGGPAKDFEEHARRMGRDVDDWREAELRLRAKEDEPWKKWRGKYNFTNFVDEYDEFQDEDSDSDSRAEGKKKYKTSAFDEFRKKESAKHRKSDYDMTNLRQVNDGKGNIDLEASDGVPSNLTDINDKLM